MCTDQEAHRQIQQMVNFILNEARDKAQEIEAKTLEDFNLEKLKIVRTMKDKVRNDFVKKMKQLETERSIARSTAINEARLKKIAAREQVFMEVQKLCTKKLTSVLDDPNKYKELCIDLIVQGMLRLIEPEVVVRCREMDKKMIESILSKAAAKYTSILLEETGVKTSVKASLDSEYLPPPPGANNLGSSWFVIYATSSQTSGISEFCKYEEVLLCCVLSNALYISQHVLSDITTWIAGGVFLMSPDKRIVCDNTLDERLNVAVEQCKPMIRKMLFPSDSKA
ncbi:putative vacuolar atp synthase subunit e [Cardiosporidium cionae]|uniref:Vacuolar atp synthase subunit e n=1 Tax=Cardiosporidium cionae TaxID=476202 RepID=A0ABQ7J819_9APIC|nr:putative vacuolar atp synthase subunit e [Cardiosporidium cionae]|eukprot:KAF8820114.1 putative vacuolar atp synthase subunit e [Cardiosporidium cionae]